MSIFSHNIYENVRTRTIVLCKTHFHEQMDLLLALRWIFFDVQ